MNKHSVNAFSSGGMAARHRRTAPQVPTRRAYLPEELVIVEEMYPKGVQLLRDTVKRMEAGGHKELAIPADQSSLDARLDIRCAVLLGDKNRLNLLQRSIGATIHLNGAIVLTR